MESFHLLAVRSLTTYRSKDSTPRKGGAMKRILMAALTLVGLLLTTAPARAADVVDEAIATLQTTSVSVSYTHLDVYKRQANLCADFFFIIDTKFFLNEKLSRQSMTCLLYTSRCV